MTDLPLVYMAGPLFDEGERWWIEKMEKLVHQSGFRTFLPHRDTPIKTEYNAREIYLKDKAIIDECTLIIANLNGITTDDGTAWELGYAFANGKYSIGYFSDWRRRFPHEKVNLMIEESLDVLVEDIDQLQVAIDAWKKANT